MNVKTTIDFVNRFGLLMITVLIVGKRKLVKFLLNTYSCSSNLGIILTVVFFRTIFS